MNKMYLYGASGHARVIADILHAMGVKIEAIIDDNPAVENLDGIEVRHDYRGESPMILAIGSNQVRMRLDQKLDCEWGKAIHPTAIVSPTATVGEGTVVENVNLSESMMELTYRLGHRTASTARETEVQEGQQEAGTE